MEKKPQRRTRRYKVRPINRRRYKHGFYKAYFRRMKAKDPAQFFKYTRMTTNNFDFLLNLITPLVTKQSRNEVLVPEERLAITLHYLSQGSSMQTIAWKFHMGKTTVHCVIKEVCEALCKVMEPEYLKRPQTEEEWKTIAQGFWEQWNFPHCIGALDGKHINMRAPSRSGSMYFNYKKTFSLVLLAACDANYRFIIADIGGYGSLNDSGTLQDSLFGEQLAENTLSIPERELLDGCQSDVAFPYWFVGDAAFPLSEHIMRPYPGVLLPDARDNFNRRSSRARRLIENAFGVLAARWRILYQPINANVELVESITKTCVCLHNYLCTHSTMYCPTGYVDYGDDEDGQWRQQAPHQLSSIRVRATNARHSLFRLRDELARYLNEEGKL